MDTAAQARRAGRSGQGMAADGPLAGGRRPPTDRAGNPPPQRPARRAGRTAASTVRDARVRADGQRPVELDVTTPDGKTHTLRAEPRDDQPGAYMAATCRASAGAYRVAATVAAADGSAASASGEAGWTAEPAADEFRRLDTRPGPAGADRRARPAARWFRPTRWSRSSPSFPTGRSPSPNRGSIRSGTSRWSSVGHRCLTAEWGLRRWKGLP